MSAFLQSLRGAKPDAACFLRLGNEQNAVYFPDDGQWQRSTLLVRDCYEKLFNIIKSRPAVLREYGPTRRRTAG
jgi:hypothetical protein